MGRPKGSTGIPSYKNVIRQGTPGAELAVPPPLTPEQLEESNRQFALKQAEDAKEAQLSKEQMPKKILTSMEMRSRIIHLMNERNYDPIREMIKIANNNNTDEKVRLEIHKELAQYIAPKLKSTDLQVSGDLQLTVNVVKFSSASGDRLAPNREAIPVRAVEVAS
jgi:hypothetical protein